MHKKFRGISILLIVMLNAALVFGQEQTLEKSAFEAIVDKAFKNLSGKTHRSISIDEKYENGSPTAAKSVKMTTEWIAPDKSRMIIDTAGQRIEKIQIGEKRYKRINDGQWELETRSGGGIAMGCGATIESESYTVSENTNLNGTSVNLYERIEKWSSVYCGSNDGKPEVWTKRFWISKEGLLLKTEHITEVPVKKSTSRTITTYEYDSKIKIEAPIK